MFIKVGSRIINLDRVSTVDLDYADRDYAEMDPCVRIAFAEVSSWCFYDDEAAALRAFFASHCRMDQYSIVDVMARYGPRASLLAGKDSRAMSLDTLA